jgi:hypothetical protein
MIAEAHLGGVLFAPIVLYMLAAAAIFAVLRSLLGRTGLLAWAWHPALFELALYASILSLLVLMF